jgi:hypothetical protein
MREAEVYQFYNFTARPDPENVHLLLTGYHLLRPRPDPLVDFDSRTGHVDFSRLGPLEP